MDAAVLRSLEAIGKGTTAQKCENEYLDFKEEKKGIKEASVDLAEAAICFANSSGGTIIVGVADNKPGKAAFVGCSIDANLLKERIYQLTTPPLLVGVEEIHFANARMLAIVVPEGVEVHSTTKGYVSQRISDKCIPLRPIDINRLTEERRGVDWSAASSGRSIEDIDPLALRYCRRLLSGSTDSKRQSYSRLNDMDLLNVLGVVSEKGDLNRAGELMLCSSAKSGPNELVVYQHRRTQAGEADSVLRVEAPMVLAFDEILQAIRVRQGITPVTLQDGQQIHIEDYPSSATREALVNALVHGDWRLGLAVQVDHSPQNLRIVSPGPLVTGITVHNILTKGSRARHPALARVFRTLGLAEEVGQGVDRMFREMIRSGRDVPEIDEDRDEVSVIFRGQPPNTRIAKFLATLPAEEREDTDALLIIRYLCRKKSVTAKDIAPIIQRDEKGAQDSLLRISSDPVLIIEPTRGTVRRRFPSYRLRGEVVARLGSAVSYHSRAMDEVDRKVIDHVSDYGEVNNRTIQRLFDVDVYQARDILRDLVGREIITRISEQKRGKAVKYGPGAAFPKRAKKVPKRSRKSPSGDTLF